MKDQAEEFLKSHSGLAEGYLRASVFTAYINGLLLIVQAWILAFIANALIFKAALIYEMGVYLLVLCLVFVLRFGLMFLSERFAFLGAQKVKSGLRRVLQGRLRQLGPFFITQHGSGSILNTLIDGLEAIDSYFADFLPAKTLMSLVPLSIVVLIAPLDWLSGAVFLFTAPLIPLFMILIGEGAERLNQKQWQKLSRMSNHFLDVVQGITTLKMFNAARREGEVISKISDEYRRDTMSVLRLAFLSSVTLEFFSTVSIALVAVFIGFRLMWGEMDFFSGFFILLLAPEFYLPLRKMGGAYHARMEAIGAVGKMIDILDAPLSVHGKKPLPLSAEHNICIRFEGVSFSYDSRQDYSLKDLSFEVRAGERVAIVGSSGSGKSTVFSLLLGFALPQHGEIYINGSALSELDISIWRQNLGWIPQSPTLFYGSVLDNIRLGCRAVSRKRVESLCERLGLDTFIQSLPQGYDTFVGEQGYGLSEGQVQRVAVARAFLRDTPLILMDEPTASLEMKTEDLLQRAMHELRREKTVLTIAHRLHTITNADKILFLEDGQLVARGSHHDLYRNHAPYARLIDFDLPYEGQDKEMD
ncbi:MAG: thiol reductant ABC exporter subunit CydD [Alphaproteobacteria bacterium]